MKIRKTKRIAHEPANKPDAALLAANERLSRKADELMAAIIGKDSAIRLLIADREKSSSIATDIISQFRQGKDGKFRALVSAEMIKDWFAGLARVSGKEEHDGRA